MKQPPFIFSNEPKYLLKRHLAFWVFWWVFQAFLYAFVPIPASLGYIKRFPQALLNSLLFLPSHVFLSYSLMYFVIPVYVVKSKYWLAAVCTSALILLTGSIAALISMYVMVPVRDAVLPQQAALIEQRLEAAKGSFYMAMLAGLRGGISIGGIAAAIKLMKHWYTEGQRNLYLQKEAAESQLQVLKAQVHPHFLFNTLNNIFSLTQNTSPAASKMLMGLSDILRYMLYEGSHPLVPLKKELRMIEDYISLERHRYGNKLDLHIGLPEATGNFYIAPLLLLPFIENCFKHGLSNMLEQPWLSLQVSLHQNTMSVKLMNSKPPSAPALHRPGIGIDNVRRRLALLYPNKHNLLTTSEEEVFIVNLKLQLEERIGQPLLVTQPAAAVATA